MGCAHSDPLWDLLVLLLDKHATRPPVSLAYYELHGDALLKGENTAKTPFDSYLVGG